MSWDADKQLVRGTGQGRFNLAIGEPVFLREVMDQYYPRHYPPDLSYPDTRPSEELLHELRKLHPKGEIVIAIGAKQALLAALSGFPRGNDVYHSHPFWPSYPTLASLSRKNFYHWADDWYDNTVHCVSSPNNPDGKQFGGRNKVQIWDAAYHHACYTEELDVKPNAEVSVWSGGKMLGAPGIRIGWLVTENKEIAERARRYVEQTTSGVPTISQHHLAATLRNTENERPALYQRAQHKLWDNFNWFEENMISLEHHCKYVEKVEDDFPNGMFAWVQATDPERFQSAMKAAGVLFVSGKACGDDTPGRWRISMGQNADVHVEAIRALKKELEK